MSISIQTIPCGAYQANAYLVGAANRKDCALIDPGDNLTGLKAAIEKSGRSLAAILLTHGHFDHMLAAQALSQETGAPVFIHSADADMLNNPQLNAYSEEAATLPAPRDMQAQFYGDTLTVAGLAFEVMHTPGHTKGSVCLYLPAARALFSGDTLFQAGFGRMDLYGGSPAQMRASLKALFAMPPETDVYPGHGPATSIGVERSRYHL